LPVGAVDDNNDIGTTGVTRLWFGGVGFERSSKLASLELRRRGLATEVGWTVGEGGGGKRGIGKSYTTLEKYSEPLVFSGRKC